MSGPIGDRRRNAYGESVVGGEIRGRRTSPRERVQQHMTEAELQQNVVDLARFCGWMVHHTHDSRRSEPGFPDLVLMHDHPRPAVLFVELKTAAGRVSREQMEWLSMFDRVAETACVWRPEHWFSGDIEDILKTYSQEWRVGRKAIEIKLGPRAEDS